jgi:hypothetical protein
MIFEPFKIIRKDPETDLDPRGQICADPLFPDQDPDPGNTVGKARVCFSPYRSGRRTFSLLFTQFVTL